MGCTASAERVKRPLTNKTSSSNVNPSKTGSTENSDQNQQKNSNEPKIDTINTHYEKQEDGVKKSEDNKAENISTESSYDTQCLNAFVKESIFEKHYKETEYYKQLSSLDRSEPDLLDAIFDILVIVPRNKTTFMKFYKKHKDKPEKVVTLMWTYEPVKKGELSLNKLINMALIVDAKNTFGDELNGDVQYAIDFIKQAWLEDAGHIIKHSIRFMKILKTVIEEKGATFNTKEQTAFGNIYSKAFEDEDIDKNQDNENNEEVYRIITWSSIYEDKDIAKKFMIKNVKGGSMIKLNIPKDCLNAGKINSIGKSCYPDEKETLIPPFTSIKLKKKANESPSKYYEVDVAKDNQDIKVSSDECSISSNENESENSESVEQSSSAEEEDNLSSF